MIHILLLIICVFSVEFFIRLKFLTIIDSMIKITKKVINVISSKYISEHWKEKIIPVYALRIMNYSIQLLFIFLITLSPIIIIDFFFNDLLVFIFSFIGIFESLFFSFGYIYIRQSFLK